VLDQQQLNAVTMRYRKNTSHLLQQRQAHQSLLISLNGFSALAAGIPDEFVE